MKEKISLNNISGITSSIGGGIGLGIASYLMNGVVDYKLVIMVIILTFIMFNYIILEKILLKNMSFVLFTLIFYFIYNLSGDFSIEKNKDVYLIIGGLIAFWYGYKKYERDKEDEIKREKNRDEQYERDKELEIIERYTNKYNNIREKIHSNSQNFLGGKSNDLTIISKNYDELLDLFYIEFYLAHKGYIDKKLWLEWDYWINLDIEGSILTCLVHFPEHNKNENFTGNLFIDSFILNYKLYNQNNSTTTIKINSKTFYEYIKSMIIFLLEKDIITDKEFIKDVKNKI